MWFKMKFVRDTALFEKYIEISGIQQVFSNDVHDFLRLVSLRKDEYLMFQGIVSEYLWLLFEGEVKMSALLSGGNTSAFDYYSINGIEIYGDLYTLWGQPSEYSISCNRDCYAFVVSLSSYREKLMSDAKFLKLVCERLSEKYFSISSRFQRLQMPPKQRFALLLIEDSEDGMFRIPLVEAAQILNTSYRTMMRLVDSFTKEGLIEKKGVRNIRILDMEKLESIAYSNQLY